LAVAEAMSILPEAALIAALKRGFHLWPSPTDGESEFLKAVLDTVVRKARDLVQAEFAALGVGEDPATPFEPWVSAGMSPETAAAIGRTPRPVGTLGVVAIGGETIRTRDVREHSAYRGLPAHHPPILSMLAVPIRYGTATLGNLYLANKRGGPEFTEEDQRIVELLASQVSLAMQLTYLQSSLRIQQAQLQGVFESSTAAILFIDEATGQVIANAKTMQLLGRGLHPQGGRQQYVDMLRRPDGGKVALEELPSSVALQGRTVPTMELAVVRTDGSRLRILESAAPVVGLGRKVLGAVVVIEDVTAARALQRLREDFAAMIVHDLRTPLQTIELDATRLIDQRGTPAPDVERLARRIVRSAKVLSGMSRDLLDASQIEAGYLHLNLEPLEPEPAVRSLVEGIRPALGEHPVETRFPPTLPLVLADRVRLAQVLTNLLDNAAKFSPAGTPIWVEVAATPEGVQFSVRDAGPGIAPENLPRLFQRYYQSGEARPKGQGRGLGLFIAKGIVEAHRGRIWVESSPGRGSAFHFLIPQVPGSSG
ncbi:MAG: sensor histidine kinase, partial [Myxococcaceae bacterium]